VSFTAKTPRDNDGVNQCWMCDHGRLTYKFINEPNRITSPSVKSTVPGERHNLTWIDVTRQVAEKLKTAKPIVYILTRPTMSVTRPMRSSAIVLPRTYA
jgi:predicted molibdopterin-dependent oxidoreductase YjgC